MRLIVSDTTTLIVLEELGKLSLLCSIFERVILSKAVVTELEAGSPEIKNKLEQSGCFELVELDSSERLDGLNLVLDRGEAEAITLACERDLPILIDERKGRKIAKQLKLNVTGFAGILIIAVRKKVLSGKEAQSILDQAIENGFRLSEKLYTQVFAALANQ